MDLIFWLGFEQALELCKNEYHRHYPKKKDSWKAMGEDDLIRLYSTAVQKHLAMGFDADWYSQLVDVVNLALMVLQRNEEDG